MATSPSRRAIVSGSWRSEFPRRWVEVSPQLWPVSSCPVCRCGEWWRAQLTGSGDQGYIPCNYVAKDTLETEE